MSKSNAYETALLALIFNATPFTGLADNAVSSPNTHLYVSLHTADPGEAGNQSTSEATYTSYARVAVIRSSAGWTVSGGSVTPVSPAVFPLGTGGSGAATYFGVGTSPTSGGVLLYKGALTPSVTLGIGIAPTITPTITED